MYPSVWFVYVAERVSTWFHSLSPAPTYLSHSQSPKPVVASVVPKPSNGLLREDSPHEYEQLVSLRPSRPAPKPPGGYAANYATLAAYSGKYFYSDIHLELKDHVERESTEVQITQK